MRNKLKIAFCVLLATTTPSLAWESQATANAAAVASAKASAFATGGSAFARGGSAYATGGAGGSARVINNVSGGTRGTWWNSVPPAFAPGTSTGANVCSSTLALGVPWASVGVPMPDEDCNRRSDASVVYGMHHRLEAQLIMCESYRVRAAFQAAGNRLCDAFNGWGR